MDIRPDYKEGTLERFYDFLREQSLTQDLYSASNIDLLNSIMDILETAKQDNKLEVNQLSIRRVEAIRQFRKKFAKTVFTTRKSYGWSQEQLALRSGLDRSSIAKIESMQRNASTEAMISLLTALNINIEFIPMEEITESCGGGLEV